MRLQISYTITDYRLRRINYSR